MTRAIRDAVGHDAGRAAYIGAANGDDPVFYGIFEAAMDLVGVGERRMIHADFPPDERTFLESADIILLAGGAPERAWQALEAAEATQTIRDRYRAGAALVGVSAGAALIGQKAIADTTAEEPELFDALGLVPWIIDAHDDARAWSRLKRAAARSGIHGLGLPSGGGLACHADLTLEPVRRAVIQFTGGDDTSLLLSASVE